MTLAYLFGCRRVRVCLCFESLVEDEKIGLGSRLGLKLLSGVF